MRNAITTIALVLAVAGAAPVHAQQGARPGTVQLRNVAEKEVTDTDATGKTTTRRVPASKAAPGEEVIYTSTFRNIGAKPAGDIVVSNPIPPHTTYVGGSAFGDNAVIAFSTDGGKSWAPADKLKVRTADGKERLAAVTDITHVRWSYRGELPPARESSVGFRVTVN